MSKNIEININTGNNIYESIYPRTSFANLIDTLALSSSKLIGNLDINRLTEKTTYIDIGEYIGEGTSIPTSMAEARISGVVITFSIGRPDFLFIKDYSKPEYCMIATKKSATSYMQVYGFHFNINNINLIGTNSNNPTLRNYTSSWDMSISNKKLISSTSSENILDSQIYLYPSNGLFQSYTNDNGKESLPRVDSRMTFNQNGVTYQWYALYFNK